MTKVQERLMLLMDEVTDICGKNGLSYCLAERTAGRAGAYGGFTNETYSFYIHMPFKDVLKFIDIVGEEYPDNRVVERPGENPDLSYTYYRYTDKTTLLIDGYSGEYFTQPGIAINIIPLREGRESRFLTGCERYMQLLNMGFDSGILSCMRIMGVNILAGIYGMERLSGKLGIPKLDTYVNDKAGIGYGLLKNIFCTKKSMASYIEKKLIKGEEEADAGKSGLWYINDTGKCINLDKDLFDNLMNKEFEKRIFLIPTDKTGYFKRLYGDKYKSLSLKEYHGTDDANVLADVDISYKDYIAFSESKGGIGYKKLMKIKRKNNIWVGRVFNPGQRQVTHTFQMVRRSVDRIDMWKKLERHRKRLREDFKKKDDQDMRKVLKGYFKKTDFFYKQKIGFYIDDEIFKYASYIWELDGKKNYAKRSTHSFRICTGMRQ